MVSCSHDFDTFVRMNNMSVLNRGSTASLYHTDAFCAKRVIRFENHNSFEREVCILKMLQPFHGL